MSVEIPVAFVHQYKDNVISLSQQRPSKLREAVRVRDGVVRQGHALRAHRRRPPPSPLTTRHAPTPLVNSQHSRVRCPLGDFGWADLTDVLDEPKMLIDPTSEYVKNAAYAMNRTMDRIIVPAFNAPLPWCRPTTDTTNSTLTNTIANGGTGLTVAKLRQAVRMLDVNDVVEEDRYFVGSPIGKEDLLATTEVTQSATSTPSGPGRGSGRYVPRDEVHLVHAAPPRGQHPLRLRVAEGRDVPRHRLRDPALHRASLRPQRLDAGAVPALGGRDSRG